MAQHNQIKIAYNNTFGSKSGGEVLDDLMTFCHMREPTATTVNATELAIRAGREDVIKYIIERMNMPSLEVVEKIVGQT